MRQIFSLRFLAAVGAVIGLFVLLLTVFDDGEVIEGDDNVDTADVQSHRIDLVEQVFASENTRFEFDDEGLSSGETGLIIDESRVLRIVPGTPGVNLCPEFPGIGSCAVVADLLGEAAVWFALVPMGEGRTVEFPAIDTLDDGRANLVNGWQLPYADVLDRRCGDEEFDSYSEFREVFGDDFTSIFDLDERQLTAVECRTRVDYAPRSTIPVIRTDRSR